MAGNHSDNYHSLNQDPWGKPGGSDDKKPQNEKPNKQNGSEQGPPDLDEVFSNLLKKLGGNKRNNNKTGNNGGPKLPISFAKLLPIIAVVLILIWAATGFYTIKEAERGVVLRFGQTHGIVQPGLNWKPTFVDQIIPVNIEQISEIKTQGSMLTKDENMVVVEMTVQYRINNPEDYLFNVVDPNNSLSQATDSALRYVVGHMTMDDILTTGRSVVREDTWKALNNIIKPYNMGLEVIDVNFQSARPPEEVKSAFDDAIKAQEDEQRYIREAEAYARAQEPLARGNARRILEQSTAYKEQVVLDAQGETERLQHLLPEYKAAPEITKQRLYIDTMEKIMSETPKVMMDSASGNNLTVLPLEQLLNSKHKAQQTKTPEATSATSTTTDNNEKSVATQPAPVKRAVTGSASYLDQSGNNDDGYIGSQYDDRNTTRKGRVE